MINHFNRDTVLLNAIHNQLDDIEIHTKVMAHNDPAISDKLKAWQDGKIPDLYFKEVLNDYLERLRGGKC